MPELADAAKMAMLSNAVALLRERVAPAVPLLNKLTLFVFPNGWNWNCVAVPVMVLVYALLNVVGSVASKLPLESRLSGNPDLTLSPEGVDPYASQAY